MALGNRLTACFWEDQWIGGRSISKIAPQLYACIPKRRRKLYTVADGVQANSWARGIHGVLGIQEIGQYLLIWQAIQHTTLSTETDHLFWKWTTGSYSAQSWYKATFQWSILCSAWKIIWRNWAPPRVKFFHSLAHQDRCWTADHLPHRGLQHNPACLLCGQAAETMVHLILSCPFSKQMWHEVLSWLRMACAPPAQES
jgi:hypothetical protein